MGINEAFAAELRNEAATTRKLLERVPEDRLNWKPHEKSMTLGRLAGHVAELPVMITSALTQDELDFATRKIEPFVPKSKAELLSTLDAKVAEALDLLVSQGDYQMGTKWRLRNADRIFLELPRAAVIRTMGLNHMIHHRGQLSVYLRLLDVPLPSIYGPTADEKTF